jgi:pimeloyl-ACP methyl ester carboxylesterase
LSPIPETSAHGAANNFRITALRRLLPWACRIAPALTARLCLRFFLTPGYPKRPAWEKAILTSAERSSLPFGKHRVAIYRWGKGEKKILLCHGWGGRGSQLGAFVRPLIDTGYTVYAFDALAHGESGGKRTDMIEYSDLLAHLVKELGPFNTIIGHSFGAANVVIAKSRHPFSVRKLVLLSCFSDGEWVLDRFGDFLNLSPRVLRTLKELHERRRNGSFRWSEMNIAKMATEELIPILFIHDRNDKEVPYSQMQIFSSMKRSNFRFMSTDGMGHRRIMRDEQVVRRVCQFVGE